MGIGRALHLPVLHPNGATGDVDTDLSAKAAAALQAAEIYPLVICISMEPMKRGIVKIGKKKSFFAAGRCISFYTAVAIGALFVVYSGPWL